jgi:hypothetical protein
MSTHRRKAESIATWAVELHPIRPFMGVLAQVFLMLAGVTFVEPANSQATWVVSPHHGVARLCGHVAHSLIDVFGLSTDSP